MPQKIINTESEKKQAVMIAVAVIGVAAIISGEAELNYANKFLDNCEKLANNYIDRLMEAEKDPDDDNSTQVDMDIK